MLCYIHRRPENTHANHQAHHDHRAVKYAQLFIFSHTIDYSLLRIKQTIKRLR